MMAWRMFTFEVLDSEGNPTGETFEEMVQHTVTELTSTEGRHARKKGFQGFAATPTRWGDSKGYYDVGLQTMVYSQRDIDRVCLEKGLTPLDDLPNGTIERCLDRQINQHLHNKKVDERWDRLVKKHGMYNADGTVNDDAAIRVWDEHCPVEDFKAGKADIALPLKHF